MSDALTLLRRYRAAWQCVQNLEYDLAQAKKKRLRKSAGLLLGFLHDAGKRVQDIENEVDNFLKITEE